MRKSITWDKEKNSVLICFPAAGSNSLRHCSNLARNSTGEKSRTATHVGQLVSSMVPVEPIGEACWKSVGTLTCKRWIHEPLRSYYWGRFHKSSVSPIYPENAEFLLAVLKYQACTCQPYRYCLLEPIVVPSASLTNSTHFLSIRSRTAIELDKSPNRILCGSLGPHPTRHDTFWNSRRFWCMFLSFHGSAPILVS